MGAIIESAYVNAMFFLNSFQKILKEVIRLKVILRNFFLFPFWSRKDFSFLELTENLKKTLTKYNTVNILLNMKKQKTKNKSHREMGDRKAAF